LLKISRKSYLSYTNIKKEKTPLTLKNRISYTLKPTRDTFLVLVNLESFVFYVFAIKEIKFPKG